MSKNAKTPTPKPATATPAAYDREQLKAAIIEALTAEDGVEIPDECVVGAFARRVGQLEARLNALTESVGKLVTGSAVDAKPAAPKGRVDALAKK